MNMHAIFLAATLAVCLFHAGLLQALFLYSRSDDTASHIVLVPLITMYLIYQERDRVFASPRGSWGWAALAAVPGLALLAAGGFYGPFAAAATSLSLGAAGLVLVCIGLFLLCYGPASARAAAFPLAFLIFLVPIPDPMMQGAVQVLKRGTTEVVAVLFALTGTTFYRQDFLFSLRDFSIIVADQCSGIRSSIALTLTSLLLGHMFLNSPWRKVVLVAVVLPITVFKNGVRIVALTLLAMHVDPSFLTGQLHRDGGIAFFLLALLMLLPVLVWLRRSEAAAVKRAAAVSLSPEVV